MRYVIWPANLDAKKSRNEGRKIPKKFAVPGVRLSEIVEACRELKLNFEVENKKYPRCWWEEVGRVLIEKDKKRKIDVMIEISKKILEIRKRKSK
ncbi:MAG: signal recognition particle subunit SRP19/SEC65 family protein [Archaeoglobaceae archaeon]|nr:signal recognition particle subunit SRP19/SEC65 family protein [Archaeoglobaceae archaeon]MCX8151825.1 signal recognition particle subunit SRP19/SEC65 family protein [Archaeoglobaceae archaeon]MDW8014343.1 signal recognition particle subunit SRP19/SEC65 family protein [Archaeoglobaceae archaeon]